MMSDIHELKEICLSRNTQILEYLYDELSKDKKFLICPASIDKHHNYEGGLVRHTLEVMKICKSMVETSDKYRADRQMKILNLDTILISALLHDYGKTSTYSKIDGEWHKTYDYTKSLHIYKSIEKAKQLLNGSNVSQDVVYCIGSHHGRLDYGALWEPKTPEAWVLHLADMSSAFFIGA